MSSMHHGANVSKGLTPTDPLVFDPSQDLQEWRRNIARWVDTISSAAEKGCDRLYKTIFATLANHLYDRGLPSAQKSIVDEAQQKGIINYKQEDQVVAVRQSIELIAVDPPIYVVSRLISSFNAVTSCRRGTKEDLGTFVSRFRGLAADHLMHGGLSSSSQVGEVLAITLLNNANLSEETLTNAKLQLINLAKAKEESDKKKKEENDMKSKDAEGRSDEPEAGRKFIPGKSYEKLQGVADSLTTALDSEDIKDQDDDSQNLSKAKLIGARSHVEYSRDKALEIVSEVDKLQDEIEAEKTASKEKDDASDEATVSSILLRVTPRCRLNLDDAVVVLRNLSFSPAKENKTYSNSEIENIVGQRVQTALLSFSKQSSASNQATNNFNGKHSGGSNTGKYKGQKNGKKNKRKLDGVSKTGDFCKDCGPTEHSRGSDDCKSPSYYTKRLKQKGSYTGGNPDSYSGHKSRGGSDFRSGSAPEKPNHH